MLKGMLQSKHLHQLAHEPRTPNHQGPAGNTAARTNPGISTAPSRTTPEIKGVGQGIRVAGENGGHQ
jgi:hypothetical protein